MRWGVYSQLHATVCLLKEAAKNKYSYYHLLSAHDLPVYPIDEIYDFFESQEKKKDFMYWGDDEKVCEYRFKTYKVFPRRKNKILDKVCRICDHIQLKLGVNRMKKYGIDYLKGESWFSITHPLCEYIVSKEKFMKKVFRKTVSPDESFVQTIALMSPYKDNMYRNSLRYTDWSKGGSHPKTLTMEDADKIIASKRLFARKFDEGKSDEIIAWMLDRINNK